MWLPYLEIDCVMISLLKLINPTLPFVAMAY